LGFSFQFAAVGWDPGSSVLHLPHATSFRDSLAWPGRSFGRHADRNIGGGYSLWLRLATVFDPLHRGAARAHIGPHILSGRADTLVLATVRTADGAGSMGDVCPTVLIVDDHEAFRSLPAPCSRQTNSM
jgi:hypothetical protein